MLWNFHNVALEGTSQCQETCFSIPTISECKSSNEFNISRWGLSVPTTSELTPLSVLNLHS